MMKIKGFTPIFDSLVEKYSHSVAYTYGKIWRYCMWSAMGRCTASNARLATETGYDEKTIRRAKDILDEDGLINRIQSKGHSDVCYVVHDLVLELYGPMHDPGHDVHTTPDIVSNEDSSKDTKNVPIISEAEKLAWIAGITIKEEGTMVVEKFLVHVQEFAKWWLSLPGFDDPTKEEIGYWTNTFNDWKKRGITLAVAKKMYQYARDNDWGIASPKSITSAKRMMVSAPTPAQKLAQQRKKTEAR